MTSITPPNGDPLQQPPSAGPAPADPVTASPAAPPGPEMPAMTEQSWEDGDNEIAQSDYLVLYRQY